MWGYCSWTKRCVAENGTGYDGLEEDRRAVELEHSEQLSTQLDFAEAFLLV
jgi:hypothetical protein